MLAISLVVEANRRNVYKKGPDKPGPFYKCIFG
jgi:hypothetical protein